MTTEQAELALAEALSIIKTECRHRSGPPIATDHPMRRHPIEELAEFDGDQVERFRAAVEALLA